MFRDHMKTVQLITMEIYHKFPDRIDRRLNIIDNTPALVSEGCSGHPGKSHAGCDVMDVNYCTHGETNVTHGMDRGLKLKVTQIWRGDSKYPENLMTDVFDWERNYYLIKRIIDLFPHCYIMMNANIRNYIISKLKQSEWGEFKRRVQGDVNRTWHHDRHCHIGLGTMLSFEEV